MWPYYPTPRRKSSTSPTTPTQPHDHIHHNHHNHRDPPSPLSPTALHPTYATTIADSPESANNPYFGSHRSHPHHSHHSHQNNQNQNHHHTPGALSVVDEDPGYTGHTAWTGRSAASGATNGSQAPLLSRDFATRPMVDRIAEAENSGSAHLHPGQAESQDSFIMVSSPDDVPKAQTDTPSRPPPKSKTENDKPLLIPPPSIHDAYVSSVITPLAPPDATPTQPPSPAAALDRPPIFRTASAPSHHPGKSHSNTPSRLLPSPLPPKPDGSRLKEGTPIVEIFNADLSEPAREMVKALKGHLEQVLQVQEQIGRMHLGLEGLTVNGPESWESLDGQKTPGGRGSEGEKGNRDTPGSLFGLGRRGSPQTPEGTGGTGGTGTGTGGSRRKSSVGGEGSTGSGMKSPGKDTPGGAKRQEEAEEALIAREKGVDEIMEKLGLLSERLRTYHSLGTPRLSFPGSNGISYSPTDQPDHPSVDAAAHKPLKTDSDNPQRKEKQVSPPHIAVANLRGRPLPPSPLIHFRGRSSSTLGPSMFSRSMTTLEETGYERPDLADHENGDGRGAHPNHPYRSGRGAGSLAPERGFTHSSTSLVGDRRPSGGGGGTSTSMNEEPQRPDKRSSNLSPLTLSMDLDDREADLGGASLSRAGSTAGRRKWSGWGFGMSTGTGSPANGNGAGKVPAEKEERGEENWVEHARMRSLEVGRMGALEGGRDGAGLGGKVAAKRWVDSPLEMVDRSRPW